MEYRNIHVIIFKLVGKYKYATQKRKFQYLLKNGKTPVAK